MRKPTRQKKQKGLAILSGSSDIPPTGNDKGPRMKILPAKIPKSKAKRAGRTRR